MVGNTYTTSLVSPVVLAIASLAGAVVHAGHPVEVFPRLIEVFITAESRGASVSRLDLQPFSKEVELHVFEIDGIRHIEAKLSKDLTTDPEQSKRVVLQRFQQLSEEYRTRMQRAATGLAKAMQYGVDRYPAIVFDGQAVVYGITDVQTALAHYRVWRREGKR